MAVVACFAVSGSREVASSARYDSSARGYEAESRTLLRHSEARCSGRWSDWLRLACFIVTRLSHNEQACFKAHESDKLPACREENTRRRTKAHESDKLPACRVFCEALRRRTKAEHGNRPDDRILLLPFKPFGRYA